MPDEDKMNLGKIYHMGKEEAAGLILNRQAMASHTFITGSTGTGKSNAVYHLLDEITKNGQTTFLVVEPAKGEYKNVFGNCTDVQVFGTNPRETPLLRMNPFAFPENIHILEHIDRLVEIFNACWPMYAAMPAVLKDAIERSYQKVAGICAILRARREFSQPSLTCWIFCRASLKSRIIPRIPKAIMWAHCAPA